MREAISLSFRRALIVTASLALLLTASTASAQYFGRNKVQWEHFNFKVLHTPHFDIYYYDQEQPVIEDVGRMAERWYTRYSPIFHHQFTKKPIVVYANAADFEQTTTTEELISQGTGGFTDPYQNRIVFPLTGDYKENDHVLGHEMVHVFQFDIANSESANRQHFNLGQLPLWLVEGMAEYFSKGRVDPLTAMWIRDATARDKLPDLRRLNDPRYFPYRYGQALLAYIGGRFGDDQVVRLFLAAGMYGQEEAFSRALGVPAKKVFEDWHAAAREMYAPVFSARPASTTQPLLAKKETRGDLNIAPSISPDGRWIAFLSTRSLFSIDLYLADAKTGKLERRLVSAEGNPHYDALRFIDSAGSWSPDSRHLAFVTIDRGDNRLAIIDVETGKVETFAIPGVDAMSNPAWSPDGHTIAVSGQVNGVTDLYLYDLQSKQVRQMTNDKYADLQPAWSPDGRTIAFVSDRGATDFASLRYDALRVYTIDVESGKITGLPLFDIALHINPQYSADGRTLYFIANPQGVPDLFSYTFANGEIRELTRSSTGVAGITDTSPALSVAGRTGDITFSVYQDNDYNIYTLPPSSTGQAVGTSYGNAMPVAALLPPARAESNVSYTTYLERPQEGLPAPTQHFTVGPYHAGLHLTYLGPPTIGVGADRFGYGASGTLSAYYSDVLGEHNVGFTIEGGGGSGLSFGDSFGGDVIYLNQQHRVNWGAGATHIPYISAFTNVFQDIVNVGGQDVLADIVQQQRDIVRFDEVSGLSQYPISTTQRVEGSLGVQHIGFKSDIEQFIFVGGQLVDDRTIHLPAPDSLSFLRGSLAYVGDTSTFGFISPVAGSRYRFEGEALTGDLHFETALADWRKYTFLRPMTFAVRGLHYGRYGSDAEDQRLSPLFVGQPWLVRGYDPGSFDAKECGPQGQNSSDCPVFDRLVGSKIAVASVEARVPLFGVRELGIISGAFFPTELFFFGDAGAAWGRNDKVHVRFNTNTTERVPVFSAGVGLRILLSYIPIELTYAKPFQRPDAGWQFGFAIQPGW